MQRAAPCRPTMKFTAGQKIPKQHFENLSRLEPYFSTMCRIWNGARQKIGKHQNSKRNFGTLLEPMRRMWNGSGQNLQQFPFAFSTLFSSCNLQCNLWLLSNWDLGQWTCRFHVSWDRSELRGSCGHEQSPDRRSCTFSPDSGLVALFHQTRVQTWFPNNTALL